MHLMLYPKSQTDFTRNGQPITGAYDAHVVREDGFYLKFKVLLDDQEQYKDIQHEMIIGAMTPDGMNQFRVYDIYPKSDHVEILALQLFYFLDHRRVEPFSLADATGEQVVAAMVNNFADSIAPYTISSSVTDTNTFFVATSSRHEDGYYNALGVANRIAKKFDAEWMLNGFDARLVPRLGKNTNALLYEHKNISDFESSLTTSSLVTRIYAHSTWTLDSDHKDYDRENSENNERSVRITVDSPLINEYSQVYETEFAYNEARSEQALRNWAMRHFTHNHRDKPKRSITVKTNIIDGTEINYGDDLVLRYLSHDIDETIRCVGYDYDPIGEEYREITLGDWRENFARTSVNESNLTAEQNDDLISRLEEQVQLVQFASNGVNRITYGTEPVPNPIDGDLWFEHPPNRPNEVTIKVYRDDDWHRLLDDFTGERFKAEMENIQALSEQLAKEQSNIQIFIDEVMEELERTQAKSDLTLNVIGEDGKYLYPNNRLEILDADDPNGLTEWDLKLEDRHFHIGHNGQGFTPGQPYTLSFTLEEIERDHAPLKVKIEPES